MWRAALTVGFLAVATCIAEDQPITAADARAGATGDVPKPAAVVTLRGQIDAFTRSVLLRDFAEARRKGASVIIIDINTPGGISTIALELSHYLKQQDIKTIAYINTTAYSAGALISLACNDIIMAPVAAIGDCAPIVIGPEGLQNLGPTERAKAESPILADFRDSAQRNGYDPLLVQAMVSINRVVHWVEKDGQRRFVDEAEYQALQKQGWNHVPGIRNPINSAGSLLTVQTEEAMMLGLARGVASSLDEMVQQQNLRLVARFQPRAGQKIVSFLSSEYVRSIAFVLFLTSLYAALHTPGHGFPEVIAVVSLAILLGVPLLTGYAQWWEILSVLIGIALLAVEIFVLPGFGVAGILGIILLLTGLIFTFVPPEPGRWSFSPSLPMTWRALQRGLAIIVGGLTASLLLCWWLRRYLPRLPYLNRLILTTTVGSESPMVGSLSNIDPSELSPRIGATGIALTDLRPGGSAQFHDPAGNAHTVSVVSDSGFVARGTPLVVRQVEGARIVVRPAQAQNQ